jgi:hypothetical protein
MSKGTQRGAKESLKMAGGLSIRLSGLACSVSRSVSCFLETVGMEPSSTLIVAFCVVFLPVALVVSLLFVDFVFFALAPKALFGKAKKASVALKGTESAEEGHGPVHRNADFQDELVKSTDG